MGKLHDCKRGLAVATPRDYNRWWRRMNELEVRAGTAEDEVAGLIEEVARLIQEGEDT